MKFKYFAQTLKQLEQTSSRNEMTEILAQLFSQVKATEIDKTCYLVLGKLKPKFVGVEFNLAEKMLIRVLARVSQKEEDKIKAVFKEKGDLGETIYEFKVKSSALKSEDLSISQVYERLLAVAQVAGEGSVERKINEMAELLRQLDPLSAKYVARIPVKKLRLGFSDMTILDALSWMVKGDKSLRPDLERAYNVSADIGKIAQVFKAKGLKGIKGLRVEIGVPIRPALSERLPNAEKVVEKLKKFAVEPKYDGFRVAIHIDKTKKIEHGKGFFKTQRSFIQIYSRNLDNITHMFPDVLEALEKVPVKQAIFDGEAIGIDLKTGDFLPFQETAQRRRKHGVKKMTEKIPIKVFIYDLLYLNGKSLLTETFKNRRKRLEKLLKSKNDKLVLTEQTIVEKGEELRRLVKKYLDLGLEGAMCKKLDEPYQAGSRNFNWVKFKKTTEDGLVDTFDCVVMGYSVGKGKRAEFGIGKVLVGLRDEKTQRVKTVSRVGTGLTEKQLVEMKKRCDRVRGDQSPANYDVNKGQIPDFWCQPKIVVEIMADEITKSPTHTAGLALRFPRLIRFRDDKDVDQITTLRELKKIYKMQ